MDYMFFEFLKFFFGGDSPEDASAGVSPIGAGVSPIGAGVSPIG
ncbi:MAG TPA: hypothetical protein PLB01_04280 [Thermoanaerobaculia bacterium]|nr:hypothetical protein [Thermoanaerobaculia bacterium]